jgi:hypothetical protein
MDETKLKETVYSGQSVKTETAMPAESPQTAETAKAPNQLQPSRYSPVTVNSTTGSSSQLADFVAFLKRTWKVWLITVGVILGLVLVVTLLQRLTEMARNAQERRYEQAIASVTPEHLIARCGQPAEDVTKEVFPVVMRTIRYQSRGDETLVFTFSRTAEQRSDWVFLSMKDENGSRAFDTPDSKIAVLPCLDSRK